MNKVILSFSVIIAVASAAPQFYNGFPFGGGYQGGNGQEGGSDPSAAAVSAESGKLAASKGSHLQAAKAQQAQGLKVQNVQADTAQGKENAFGGLKAVSKGTATSKGSRFGKTETFGETWDDTAAWDDGMLAVKEKDSEGSKGTMKALKVETGKQAQVQQLHADQGENGNESR